MIRKLIQKIKGLGEAPKIKPTKNSTLHIGNVDMIGRRIEVNCAYIDGKYTITNIRMLD